MADYLHDVVSGHTLSSIVEAVEAWVDHGDPLVSRFVMVQAVADTSLVHCDDKGLELLLGE